MRATIRTDDGEGELVAGTGYAPYPANAVACAPNLGSTVIIVNGQGWQPLPKLPPPAAACAGNPTVWAASF